jgi:hypothetical protein
MTAVGCYKALGNSFMVPAELQWHLHIKDVDCKDKLISFLNVNVIN